ncbi:MAG: TlpA disulfide reductase family protein [Bacteroidota bacterium]|nr:TlpA disulfide reductase family protein [Bacteroidota bacterium]
MNKFVSILLLSVLVYSCKQSGPKIVVKGKLEKAKSEYVYFQELTVKNDGKIDSVMLDKSGSFKFKRDIQYTSFFTLWVGNDRPITLIIEPGDRIKITGRADSLFYTYSVNGSDESKFAQQLSQKLAKTQASVDSLNHIYQQFLNNKNIANIRNVLTMNYEQILEGQRKFSIDFIEKHSSSFASLMALYQQVNKNSFIFYKVEDFKYFSRVDSIMYKKFPNAPYVNSLHANVKEMIEQQRVSDMERMLSEMGAKAPDIALPTFRGDTVRLSSFKGKYVLLDFWASWDKPSRAENANFPALYRKYNYKGFEIYQVSLDKSKDAWITAIREDGLWWTQVSDLKVWESPIFKHYTVKKVPATYLIDDKGVIIAKDLRGEELSNKLAEIFDKADNTTSTQTSPSGN